MALAKKPVTGMKDITPQEMQIREYVMNQIKETYKSFGFSQIETPCVEHIENLTSKQGGDNEKLIFKILKRGEKLNLEHASSEKDLVDSGLRYDLTLPLSRYYSNHAASLPNPFKALQMGSVWRADRPQKGRFRQFVQCDIDILGDATSLAEIELILATATALGRICPDNGFTVRINDRGILRGMALHCGFPEDSMEQVFIILDKMDKIGLEGVERELLEAGYAKASVTAYLELLKNVNKDATGVRALGEQLSDVLPVEISRNLAHIMDTVAEVAEARFGLEFDPTLVRGMSYYTGTIFEVSMKGFGGSVAGGGRYDKMIGRFTGIETPACGFSIGFERIVTILLDNGFTVPGATGKKAFLFEKGMDSGVLAGIIREAMQERSRGVQVLVAQMNKNKRFQKEQLSREGYTEFKEFYRKSLKN
ncbi:MAG: histidine--tRNA ligase [Clostridiaceae bacterium]|uniref:Histidine--tRNA ligase n=2 Tax=Clostridium porci TaxID=2605778 RepID=A0A7X2NLW3_9CLOT|nr:histidine--tRNA ligase [Clostridium porci]MDY3232369.1 histidine--tRNA ligase [Clostridiaceae bacterium]MSS37188.1 histidine--tRNA ligase [Clostridium porci]